MIKFLLFMFLIYTVLNNPYLWITARNLPWIIFYIPIDVFRYFRYRKWRNLDMGNIICYCAPKFGGGKTLSAVEYIVSLYNAYNGKIVWDFSQGKFVKQVVQVISNVEFKNIPYVDFKSLKQICDTAKGQKVIDAENGTMTCSIFFIDEASSELNSRSFKNNLNPYVLKDMVTCRHSHISVVMTSQDFSLIDALMRTVTSKVIYSFKTWRYCVHKIYDPKVLENVGSYLLTKPVGFGGFFVKDKNYNAYDTFATVQQMVKKFEEKDILSTEQILAGLAPVAVNPDAVLNPSKRLRMAWKKKAKIK